MDYWSRTGNVLDIASFLLLCSLWALGGIGIANTGFYLKSREKLLAGLATGFILFSEISAILLRLLPLPAAYWLSDIFLALVGLVLFLRSRGLAWLKAAVRAKIRIPPLLLLAALSLAILVFTWILRGLAIFDDYFQLPLISQMATGDIPPHFYLNPSLHLPYHYGLQVFAAGLVRLGGLFPWSAWDISRAVTLGFTLILGWLWIRRETNSGLAASLGGILLMFGGAARWLLLLIPQSLLLRMGGHLHMDRPGGRWQPAFRADEPLAGGRRRPVPIPLRFRQRHPRTPHYEPGGNLRSLGNDGAFAAAPLPAAA